MIRPRHKRLLVEPIDNESQSKIIAVVEFDKFNQKASGLEAKSWTRGRVLALGDDCDKVNGAKVGDIVQFTKIGGLPIQENGKDYLLLSEKDLFGVEFDETEAS